MKIRIFCVLFWLISSANAQKLSLQTCQQQAQQNYPLIRQNDLLAKSTQLSIENLLKGYLPQLGIFGQATYQSDVTSLSLSLPIQGFKTPEAIAKDQYKVFGELNQVLYDGGAIRQQQKIQKATLEIEQQKTATELYKIRERVNQFFFGILLLDEQIALLEITKKDLENNFKKTKAAVENGASLKSNIDLLEAEILKVEQRGIELEAAKKTFLDMLGYFIKQDLDQNTVLEKPQNLVLGQEISRPELQLFNKQQSFLEAQNALINVRNTPKLSFFVQAGYGRPALNMLKNDFDSYYLGGFRLSWQFGGFYTLKNDRQIIVLQKQQIELQKQTFLFNTNLALRQQNNELQKIEDLLKSDQKLIELRAKIRTTAQAQMENGVITTADYLRELNAEEQAKQNFILHQIQFLMTQYQAQFVAGNVD